MSVHARFLRGFLFGALALPLAFATLARAQQRPPPPPARPTANAAPTASAEPEPSSPWPMNVPGLAAQIANPSDSTEWSVATRVETAAVTVVAVAHEGSLALTLRRPRGAARTEADAPEGCLAMAARWMHASPDALRSTLDANANNTNNAPTPTPTVVFRGAAWEPVVLHPSDREYDAELGCLRTPSGPWLAVALARPSTGHPLIEVAALAQRLGAALASPSARSEFPLRLQASRVDLVTPGDETPWQLTGVAEGMPFPSDTLTSTPAAPGGLTVTVGRRPRSTCAAADEQLRAVLRAEGTLVDRPGYVPASFGSRVRRIEAAPDPLRSLHVARESETARAPRTREVYCADLRGDALVVTAAFARDDGEAMAHLAPLLRAVARGSGLVR